MSQGPDFSKNQGVLIVLMFSEQVTQRGLCMCGHTRGGHVQL